MAGVNRATYFTQEEDRAIQSIAEERRWSVSQTIAELARESQTLQRAMAAITAEPTAATTAAD